MPDRVLIVGAGPTGLTAALEHALHLRGAALRSFWSDNARATADQDVLLDTFTGAETKMV